MGGIGVGAYAFSPSDGFQVVPPCGGHPGCCSRLSSASRFQVVPPCGGHPLRILVVLSREMFQVVPPCGGHLIWAITNIPKMAVSSRAPVWGASSNSSIAPISDSFQVVPPCGGHHGNCQYPKKHQFGFKSCPRVGGILLGVFAQMEREMFQVVPPCGGHPDGAPGPAGPAGFQVVPPCGGHRERLKSHIQLKMFQVVPPCGGHQSRRTK